MLFVFKNRGDGLDCWELLKIKPTVDKLIIKKAYVKQLQHFHPEEDAIGFQRLRLAYEAALQATVIITETQEQALIYQDTKAGSSVCAEQTTITASGTESNLNEALPQFMQQVTAIYSDFFVRIDIEQWRRLLNKSEYQTIHIKQLLGKEMLNFLQEHYHLPQSVWALFDRHFFWTDQEQTLYDKYPTGFVRYLMGKIHKSWGLRYIFTRRDHNCDYDAYLQFRADAFQALIINDLAGAWQCLESGREIYDADPDLLRMYCEFFTRVADRENALQSIQALMALEPDAIDAYIYRGDLYLKQGDYRQALSDYQQVLQQQPDYWHALRGTACCYLGLGHIREAKIILEQLISLNLGDIELHLQLVVLNTQLKAELSAALLVTPDDHMLQTQLAQTQFELKQYDECRLLLESVNSAGRLTSAMWLLWGRVLNATEQQAAAIDCFSRSLELAKRDGGNGYEALLQRGIANYYFERYTSALSDLNSAYKLNPFDPEILYYIAEVYYAQNDDDNALTFIDQAIDLHSTPPWYYYSTRALVYYFSGDFPRAQKDLIKVTKFRYGWPLAWYRKAYCHIRQREYQKAKECFLAGIKWDDSLNPDIYFYLALAYSQLGDYQAALQELEQYHGSANVALEPDGYSATNGTARKRLLTGDLYRAVGNIEAANAEYVAASMEAPDSYPLAQVAMLQLLSHRSFDKSLDLLRRMASIRANDAWVILHTIWTLMETNNWRSARQAAEHYCQAVNETSEQFEPAIYFYYGRILYQLGHYKEALPWLVKACNSQATNGDFASCRSLVHYELGEVEQALVWAQRAVACDAQRSDYHLRYQGILTAEDKPMFMGFFKRRVDSRKAWPDTQPLWHHRLELLPAWHLLTGAENFE